MISFIDEDDKPGRQTAEELAKIKSDLQIPRGTARLALAIALDRHDQGKGPPKKTLNRIAYRYIQIMMDEKMDPKLFIDCWEDVQDRLDGKAAQAVNLGDNEGGRLVLTIAATDTNVL